MGYFSNGTEGEIYEEEFCRKCVHDINYNCSVLLLHRIHNYDACNNDKSFLHVLIPQTEDGLGNEQCTMFVKK